MKKNSQKSVKRYIDLLEYYNGACYARPVPFNFFPKKTMTQ